MTKYYKRIGEEDSGYTMGLIYPEDATPKPSYMYSLKGSLRNFPNRWKEVSKKEYLEQEGWYIKGSDELMYKMLNNKDYRNTDIWLFNAKGNYYFIDGNNNWKALNNKKGKPKGIEITVDKLDEIFNIKPKEKEMENFTVKVQGVTIEIVYNLISKNNWKISFSGDVQMKHYLIFFPRTREVAFTASKSYARDNYNLVSLEEAIELITKKDKPVEIFGYKVTKLDDGRYKFGCNDHIYTKDELNRIKNTLANIPVGTSIYKLLHELSKVFDL